MLRVPKLQPLIYIIKQQFHMSMVTTKHEASDK